MQHTLPSFEELRALAEHRPDALESLRRDLTDAVIASAPDARQPRLRALQFQIETRCRLAATPMAACIWVSRQMHNTLENLHLALNHQLPPSQDRCAVLPFTRPSPESRH